MRRFFRRIKNVLYWLPVIWDDYWFDYVYLLKIMRHKLMQMAPAFRDKGMSVDSEDQATEMEEVIAALHRLIENDYCKDDLHTWCEKWGKMVSEPDENRPGWRRFVGFENEHTPEDTEQVHAENRAMCEKEEMLRMADRMAIAHALMFQLEGWWD
jgi:hypothetical protein